jgi:hypothetical protein
MSGKKAKRKAKFVRVEVPKGVPAEQVSHMANGIVASAVATARAGHTPRAVVLSQEHIGAHISALTSMGAHRGEHGLGLQRLALDLAIIMWGQEAALAALDVTGVVVAAQTELADEGCVKAWWQMGEGFFAFVREVDAEPLVLEETTDAEPALRLVDDEPEPEKTTEIRKVPIAWVLVELGKEEERGWRELAHELAEKVRAWEPETDEGEEEARPWEPEPGEEEVSHG